MADLECPVILYVILEMEFAREDSGTCGAKKKGNKGKKQVLMNWG